MALRYATELGAFDRVRNDLAFQVRRRIFERFMRECAPGPDARVAAFGVSGHRDHPVHYFFESLSPHRRQPTLIAWAAGAFLCFSPPPRHTPVRMPAPPLLPSTPVPLPGGGWKGAPSGDRGDTRRSTSRLPSIPIT